MMLLLCRALLFIQVFSVSRAPSIITIVRKHEKKNNNHVRSPKPIFVLDSALGLRMEPQEINNESFSLSIFRLFAFGARRDFDCARELRGLQ